MMGSWWWTWIIVMVLFSVLPMGYGWGYRGWGPALPPVYPATSRGTCRGEH
ncbi:hypothetical protein BH09MYX1_BH09MYX1_29260 [soil metagenome]